MTSGEHEYFIVACHGWSASNWVAHALNRLPGIACAHSSAAALATDPERLEGANLKAEIPALRKGYVQRQSRPILDIYADVAAAKPAPHVGSVHTFRMRDLPVQAERFPQSGVRFRTVNLVRHPLDLVVSGYGQFRDLFRIDLNEFSWTLAKIVSLGLDLAEMVCARHGVAPGDFDSVCFLGACVVLNSLRLDLDATAKVLAGPEGPWDWRGVVRMEDVTGEPAAFADLVERITGDAALAAAPMVAEISATRRINIHNRSAAAGTRARWQGLSPWQREAFAAFLVRFGLRADYETFGYDFSFLDEG